MENLQSEIFYKTTLKSELKSKNNSNEKGYIYSIELEKDDVKFDYTVLNKEDNSINLKKSSKWYKKEAKKSKKLWKEINGLLNQLSSYPSISLNSN